MSRQPLVRTSCEFAGTGKDHPAAQSAQDYASDSTPTFVTEFCLHAANVPEQATAVGNAIVNPVNSDRVIKDEWLNKTHAVGTIVTVLAASVQWAAAQSAAFFAPRRSPARAEKALPIVIRAAGYLSAGRGASGPGDGGPWGFGNPIQGPSADVGKLPYCDRPGEAPPRGPRGCWRHRGCNEGRRES